MKEFFGNIFSWLTTKLFGPSQQEKAFSEILKLFEIKCQEFDKQKQEIDKIREAQASDREDYRRLSQEYYDCEESRAKMAGEVSTLKMRVFALETEISRVQSELDRVKNGQK